MFQLTYFPKINQSFAVQYQDCLVWFELQCVVQCDVLRTSALQCKIQQGIHCISVECGLGVYGTVECSVHCQYTRCVQCQYAGVCTVVCSGDIWECAVQCAVVVYGSVQCSRENLEKISKTLFLFIFFIFHLNFFFAKKLNLKCLSLSFAK